MNGATPRMALVIVWFGPWPFWMPAFLLSCRWNPDVDWLIFGDSPAPSGGVPPNVRFMGLAMDAFNHRATAAVGFKVRLDPSYAYKLCDLKIMYGRIFAAELRDYDFWGCCDMDVVWGRIGDFMTPALLRQYDVLTSRVGRISGHFCLFRNRPEWAALYNRISGVQVRVADHRQYRRIDEGGLTDLLRGYQQSGLRRAWARYISRHAIPRVFWDRVLTTSGKHQRQMNADPSLRLCWREGRTYGVDGEELMYLHFHAVRKQMKGIDFDWRVAPAAFSITPPGFFKQPAASALLQRRTGSR